MKRIRKIGYSMIVVGVLVVLTGCPANHFQQGLALMEAGNIDSAIAELQLALEKDPYNGEIYYNLGLLYLQKEEYRTALGYFQQVVTNYPQENILDGAYYYLGFCQYYAREYKAAARNFSLLLSRSPEGGFAEHAYFYQAEVAWHAEEIEQALNGYGELLRRYPAGAYAGFARFRLGECHYRLRNFVEAVNAYQQFLANDNGAEQDAMIVEATETESEEPEIRAGFSDDVMLRARGDAAFRRALSYVGLGERDQAISAFQDVVYGASTSAERRTEALYRQGKLYLEAGNAQQALDTLAVLVKENPTSEYADDALFLQGSAAYTLKKKKPLAVSFLSSLYISPLTSSLNPIPCTLVIFTLGSAFRYFLNFVHSCFRCAVLCRL